jgi:exonuclease III
MMASEAIYKLKIISYNMHGFNQGHSSVEELIQLLNPDVFLLQEHWLTPANMYKLSVFSDYFVYGCSAMSKTVEMGVLSGRPFGGVCFLINSNIRELCTSIVNSERFAIVKICNYILVNIYLPCAGSKDRLVTTEDIFYEIRSWLDQYSDYECIIAGDFNVDLDCQDPMAQLISKFCEERSLNRCDNLFDKAKCYTYVNMALNHYSTIDYMLTSSPHEIIDFEVIDPDINYSDHLPLMLTFNAILKPNSLCHSNKPAVRSNAPVHKQLRWDRADLISYYQYTGSVLAPIMDKVNEVTTNYSQSSHYEVSDTIDKLVTETTNALIDGATKFVPQYRKDFFKFWWNEEMELLKEASIESNRIWKAAGRPRNGPLFDKRQSCRLLYRKRIRENQRNATSVYTNELHSALLKKDGSSFWKVWRSKFDCSKNPVEVEGCMDANVITDKFASYFSAPVSASDTQYAADMQADFCGLRNIYCGTPLDAADMFDVELVSKVIDKLKRGKAAGLDTLTTEHLINCHPSIICILNKLFNLMLLSGHLPYVFGLSYTVPLPKDGKASSSKSFSCADFRGIAISSILSKVFEYCILGRFDNFLSSNDNQFGFKKGLSCSHAIYTVRNIVNRFIDGGSTVNLCALDLSKAFDKVNHNVLLMKLMKRRIPIELLNVFEYWLNNCWSCVKWNGHLSNFYKLELGVRQGSVLSPFFFAVYLDDLLDYRRNGYQCFVILYADDIILIAQSVCELQRTLLTCERELLAIGMSINIKKSCCMRIGPRFDAACNNITTSSGYCLPWVDEIRYLGVHIVSSRLFKCSFDQSKRSFYRSINAVFGRIGRIASEEVMIQLVIQKCLPILLYGVEACPITISAAKSFDFVMNRFLMKLFQTSNLNIINDCSSFFGIVMPSKLIELRYTGFLVRYNTVNNAICNLFVK